MRLKLILLIWVFFCIANESTQAQEHNHEHSKYHLATGLGATWLFAEEVVMPGIHFHAMRNIDDHGKYSAGLGFETLLDEHAHHTVSFLVGYSPIERLTIEAGPGWTFSKHEGAWENGLSGHLECIYEFEWKGIHLGPMAGVGFDHEETHFSLGLHVGIGLK